MANKKLSEITQTDLYDGTQFYTQLSGVTGKTDLTSLSDAVSARIQLDPSDPSIVSYENLNNNGDVGQIAGTVAAGDDTRFLTNNQAASVAASDNPTGANPVITQSTLDSTIADISGQFVMIQGSIDRTNNFPATHVDSTMVAEEDHPTTWLGTVYCSLLNAGNGGTTINWSDVLPLSVPTGTKYTILNGNAIDSNNNNGSDENHGYISIVINWVTSRINGYAMYQHGEGMGYQACFRFTGTTNGDISGVRQNGSWGSGYSTPVIGTTFNTITKLPVWEAFMNFTYNIEHRSF